MVSMGHKGNGPALLHAQAACRSIDLEIVLPGQGTDLYLCFLTDQRTVVQCPRDRGLGNSSQPGDISYGSYRLDAHVACFMQPIALYGRKIALSRGQVLG